MDRSAKPRKRPGPIHQSSTQNIKRAPPPPPQAGATLAAFLDNIKAGYSRFTDAFVAHGWEDQADLLYTQGVLEGGSIVDLNLPSDYDAQKMLLNEAGLDADPSDAPPEAAEVTKFCNNLPLAVGMAGRLLKTMSLSIDDDWSGVVAVLKSEFGEGGQARSMENSIIRTSLKSIRGSQHDEVVQLFHAFALVPEDTICPLEIIGIMFAATGLVLQKGKSRRLQTIPPRLMVRKWLKILIDRSLVLGTVDRPQLHDIVLEYVEAQFTEQECRQAHREVIKKFREATPAGGWSRLGAGTDLTSYYVVHEIEHHISAAWGKDKTGDKVAVGWCSDLWQGKTDAITSAATLYLGYDKLQVFAEDAEAKNDHWRAVRQYTAVISAVCVEGGDVNIQQVLCKRMYSELKLCTQDTPEQKFEFETIEIDVVLRLIKCWNKDDLDVLIPRVPFLLETDAAKNDFQCEYCLKIMLEVIPDMMSGNSKKMFAAIREVTLSQMAKTKALTDPGHINRSKLLEIGYTAILFDGLVADPDFVDALYGERGCRIEERYAGYDRDTDHVDCNVLFSADPIIASIGDVKALMFFWGEIDRARAMARWHINECAACFATREVRAELPTIWMASTFMPEACILTGLQSEAHTFVCEANNNCSYDELEDSMYDLLAMFTACTSKKYPKEGTIMNLLPLAWHNKFLWLLSAPQAKLDKLKPEILFEGLPGAKALACSHFEGTVLEHPHGYTCELALLCWPALLFERLGLHERALEFAEQALETVAGEGGNVASWNHILAHGVKGRIFLKTDKTAEAVKQFELGIEIAAVRKYAFLEAITLRDLKSALPQATSKHSAAERRFGTIMKTLAHGSSESKKDIEALVSTIFLAWE